MLINNLIFLRIVQIRTDDDHEEDAHFLDIIGFKIKIFEIF